jgi:hypothetical protein
MDSSRMQSSPPRGASPRPLPASPETSRYELDLDALEGSSISSSPVAEREIPRVLSEDIDGPSDFTINMMDWMKGERALGRNNNENSAAITSGTPSILRINEPHLQPTVEDYSSPARPNNPTPLGGRTPASDRSPGGTIGRNSMLSPIQAQGGASQYLMGQIERLRSELAAEKEERAAERAAHLAEVERMSAQHVRELQAVTSELRATRDAHTTEIRRLSVDYSQQLRATFEAAANAARKTKAAHAAEMERTRAQSAKELQSAKNASIECKAACVAEMARLKSQHIEQMRAVTSAFKTTEEDHANEMAELRSEHEQELQATTGGNEGLEEAHAAEIERIIAEHKTRDAAKDAAITEKVHNRETRYKQKIATRDTKLAERDAEILELRSKMEHLERMYKSMGTELMRAWGREEFGDTGEKQKYRYKYTKATAA